MKKINKKVLVLNKSWQAVGTVNLQRAICLLFSEYSDGEPKALVIDPTKNFQTFTWKTWSEIKPTSEEETIRSINLIFKIPKVILLSRYNKLPCKSIHFCRKSIFKRDKYQCQYCGCKPGSENLSLDHLIPRSASGKTTWENICLACIDCNKNKSNKIPKKYSVIENNKNITYYVVYFRGKKEVKIKEPCKPSHEFFNKVITCDTWREFVSNCYWFTELENDNHE